MMSVLAMDYVRPVLRREMTNMYTIEHDVPYETSYAKCKNPELREAAHKMKVGDSIFVETKEECALLQSYISRIKRPQEFWESRYDEQLSRRKKQAGPNGMTQGYRVWRLA